jgi:hypothetical protein
MDRNRFGAVNFALKIRSMWLSNPAGNADGRDEARTFHGPLNAIPISTG